ncbi:hypothetical protein MMC34_004132 [Xylographa carneopallida]|nr:hypothetical protein [Xylographa carneopallida]
MFPLLKQLLIYLTFVTSTSDPISARPLLAKFHSAMEEADLRMRGVDHPTAVRFENGGGCYTGFGHVNLQECRDALALMPSHNLRPDDLTEGLDGQVLTRDFYRREPKIWKAAGECVIGATLYDRAGVKGLYPLFQQAASLIIQKCAARSIGGLIRFSHFEVVVFDQGLLPRRVPDYIYDFSRQSVNIPFSRGLERLWQQRSRQEAQ